MQNQNMKYGNPKATAVPATPTGRKPDYIANAVNGDEVKTYWTRIGVAFKNKAREDGQDGGYTILLNATPVNGKIILTLPLTEKE